MATTSDLANISQMSVDKVSEKKTWEEHLKKAIITLKNSKAELIVFLFSLSFYMPTAFVQQLIIEKLCLEKQYDRDYCFGSVVNKTIEEELQGDATQYLLYHYLMRQLPAVILALFMGQWSDKYGRKFILQISVFGNLLTFILYMLNYYYVDWGPLMMVVAAVPAGATGDYAAFMLGLFGYIKDVNTMSSLSMRISMADGFEMFASQIGPLIGGQLYQEYKYPAVFGICIVFLIIDMICIQIFIDDKQFVKNDICTTFKDFFRISGFIDCIKTVFKKRPGHRRAYILLVMLSAMLILFGMYGHIEIMYMFARLVVQWDVVWMTYYNMALGACNAVGLLILMPVLMKLFHLTDTHLGIIGQLAFIAFYLSTAFAKSSLAIFLLCGFQIPALMCIVTLRSLISKCLTSNEVGKVMAVYAVLQAFYRNLGQTVATQIYSHTFKVLPGAFFVFCGSILIFCVIIYTWIHLDLKKENLILEKQPENLEFSEHGQNGQDYKF
ncbi:hypothetical protein CHUAL_004163 [Chamberlinius hualienensis]